VCVCVTIESTSRLCDVMFFFLWREKLIEHGQSDLQFLGSKRQVNSRLFLKMLLQRASYVGYNISYDGRRVVSSVP
jgi:hypothetical protein